MINPHPQAGQAALIMLVILVPAAVLIAFSINTVTFANKKTAAAFIDSLESYYVSEAGIEDSLLRLIRSDLQHQSANSITLAGNTATVTIEESGSTYTITSAGDAQNRRRKLSTRLERNTSGVSFFYGVQVGDGGLNMVNNAKVVGNVYSNGSIDGNNNAEITEDAFVAGANVMDQVTVGGDAHANTIDRSAIGIDAYYQTITATSVGGTEFPGSPDPDPQPMPISDEQITEWKNDAAAGGQISSLTLSDSQTSIQGPVKINGNLTMSNDAKLTMTGTIWITGDVLMTNDTAIQLSPSFGTLSGVIVVDGEVAIENNAVLCGSEGYSFIAQACNETNGSHILLLSTSTSLNESSPAIHMKNNGILHGILYTSAGRLVLENNAALKEATAYAMTIKNNAVVTYESGLANAQFSSGPAGGFTIMQWQEIE